MARNTKGTLPMNKVTQLCMHAIVLLALSAATGLSDAPGLQALHRVVSRHGYALFVLSTLAAMHGTPGAVVLIFGGSILYDFPDVQGATQNAITVTLGLLIGTIGKRVLHSIAPPEKP
jgi:hypothetical protein